jgi:type II secretory pathway component GspD/PulD (secretin)
MTASLAAATLLLLGVGTPLVAAAEPPAGGAVSLNVSAADLRAAVRLLASKAPAGATVEVADALPADTRVMASLSAQTFESALRTLVRAASRPLALERTEQGGAVRYRIVPRQAVAAPASAPVAETTAPKPAATVTLNVRNARFGDVLKAVLGPDTRVRFAEPGLADSVTVTATFEKRAPDAALDAVTESAAPRLDWFREGETYVFARRAGAATSAVAEDAGPRVSLDVRDGDVRQVVEDLFRRARVSSFTIGADVRGVVTLRVQDKPLGEALALLCRVSTPPLRWSRLPDGTYEVRAARSGAGGQGGL